MRIVVLAWLALAAGCVATAPERPAAPPWKTTNATLHERLARAALEKGRHVEAAASAREALRVDPERVGALLVLCRALLAGGAPAEAEGYAQRALELRPDSAEVLLALAECAAAAGRDEEARRLCRRAAATGSGEAALVLGAFLLEDGDEAGARALLDGTEPTVRSLAVLATHCWLAGRPQEAEELLVRALEQDPEDRAVRLELAQLRLAEGLAGGRADGSPAGHVAGRAAPLEERLLGAAGLLRDGRTIDAAAEYRALARVLPEDPLVRVALGEALLGHDDVDGAEAAFRAAGRVDPGCREALVGLARARLRGGTPAEAVLPLERALRLDPDHVATRSLLVVACARSGDLVRAQDEAEEVRLLAPGSALDLACRRMLHRTATPGADEERETP